MNPPPVQPATPSPADSRDGMERTLPGAAKWLGFSAPPLRYLFALEHIGEVLPARALTKIPFTQPWFCGAVSVRGVLHGVIDLAALLSLADGDDTDAAHPQAPSRPQAETSGNHLVTISAALNWPCALVVGSLQGLRNPADFPGVIENISAGRRLLLAVRHDTLDAQWLEIDVPAVVALMRSLGIQA